MDIADARVLAQAADRTVALETGRIEGEVQGQGLTARVSGSFDAEGGFSAVLPQLEVRLAGGTFLTEQVGISAEGLSAAAPEKKMGMKGSPTAQLHFDGVRVADVLFKEMLVQ